MKQTQTKRLWTLQSSHFVSREVLLPLGVQYAEFPRKPWCQQERTLTLGWEQDDHTSVLPFPTLKENKTKQPETTPYCTVSEGSTKPREIKMSQLAQEPGSSQCCFPPEPSAVGCARAELAGPSLTRAVKVLSPRAVKPSLCLLSQHRNFWRNATQNQPPLLSHRQAPAKPGQHCSGLQRSQHSLNAQRGQPFDLPVQLTLSVLHGDHCKGLPPKPDSNIHREAAAGLPLCKRHGICTSLFLATAQAPHPTALCYGHTGAPGMVLTSRHHKNSLGKEALWIWHGAVLQEWDNRNHAVMLVCLLGNASGRHKHTKERERR